MPICFRRSRESTLLSRILEDYRRLHPHADDGLAIAVYHNGDIQPVIAAVDEFLRITCAERSAARKDYAFSVTVFSESSDDTSVSRWVAQWKDRWADSENQASLSHYRRSALSIAHRIVSPDNYYRQFIQLIGDSLEIDIVFLMDIIRAGNQGNDFETVEPYDVLTRTLKFPILEKPFCALRDPSQEAPDGHVCLVIGNFGRQRVTPSSWPVSRAAMCARMRTTSSWAMGIMPHGKELLTLFIERLSG